MKTIAVFGGGRILPGELDYINAQMVGRFLAQAGYHVMTGGYTGIMEAASRGAAEAGGHVIGITLTEEVRGTYPPDANAWVKEEIRYDTRLKRLIHLVLRSDAYVILPGSEGTEWELETVWEKMVTGEMALKPVICLGETWRAMVQQLVKATDNAGRVQAVWHFTDSPLVVIDILKASL